MSGAPGDTERDSIAVMLDSIRRCTNIAKSAVQRLEVMHARYPTNDYPPGLLVQLETARKLRDEMLRKQDIAERAERRYRELREQARKLEEERRARGGS